MIQGRKDKFKAIVEEQAKLNDTLAQVVRTEKRLYLISSCRSSQDTSYLGVECCDIVGRKLVLHHVGDFSYCSDEGDFLSSRPAVEYRFMSAKGFFFPPFDCLIPMEVSQAYGQAQNSRS